MCVDVYVCRHYYTYVAAKTIKSFSLSIINNSVGERDVQ